jgi:cytochrome c biogenesis protein CcmG/thiol:disulfide interchange protein DsbE
MTGEWFRRRIGVFVPLAVFVALAVLFFVRLAGPAPGNLPSALAGKQIPDFSLPPLDGLMQNGVQVPALSASSLKGRVSIVNIWASWCGPCREEHPFLVTLSKNTQINLVGINYKDDPENARRFLGTFGNPFSSVGRDSAGRTAIDWGVYGVPETFIVAADGTILYRHVGPLTVDAIAGPIQNAIEKAVALR